jgi:hypothetical protein
VSESDTDIIEIQIHYNGPALPKDDITVFYSISGDARENIDYRILSEAGKVIIDDDYNFGIIEVEMINNANNILRSQDLILTLNVASPGYVGIGQNENGPNKIFTLTIEDDCILGGRYLGLVDDFSVPEEDIFILSNDCEEYFLTNYAIGEFTFFGNRPLFFMDNNDNTLTVPEQKDDWFPDSLATIRGFGVVNPATNEMIFNIEFVDFGDSTFSFKLVPD